MNDFLNYTPNIRQMWNVFNRSARNGHMLFDREYMDYHSDRFDDCSLVAKQDGRLIALLPANRVGDIVYSHQGLTFGGLILSDEIGTGEFLPLFESLLAHLREKGATRFLYKASPWIYHRRPSQEDLYALFRFGARLVRRDVSTTIDYQAPGRRSSRRERGVKKARKADLTFGESRRLEGFWGVLTEVLQTRHATQPTHTAEEICLLAKRFPESIRLFTAEIEQKIEAGVLIYETPTVAHAQYIATSTTGRSCGALDGLFDYLINAYSNKRYFDFGVSTEREGFSLNEGLIKQKEEFGGSAVVYETYELAL